LVKERSTEKKKNDSIRDDSQPHNKISDGVPLEHSTANGSIHIPWFAVGFIAMVGFNSLQLVPEVWIENINRVDTFLLAMAMTALGIETRVEKFKGIGLKPFYLASIIFIWLIFGGYFISKWAVG
jgi:uncharacterized integral membrane protein (TIGR00698 family)